MVLGGCAPSLEPFVRRRTETSFAPPDSGRVRIAFVVPENRNRLRKPGDAEQMDDAAEILRDVLARAASEHGCDLVEQRGLDSLVAQEFPGGRDLTDGQAARVAEAFHARYVVFGRLDAWARGHMFARSTTLAFRLDVVDSLGTALFRVRHYGTAAQEDPADLARILAAQAVDSLVGALGGCTAGER